MRSNGPAGALRRVRALTLIGCFCLSATTASSQRIIIIGKPLRLSTLLQDVTAAALEDDDSSTNITTTTTTVQERYITQQLDHFRPVDNRTFAQRYFYSDAYVVHNDHNDTTPPQLAFLCVGGEGPALDTSVLMDSVHCSGDMLETAKRIHNEFGWNIHLFALEHRYYGQSYPDFSTSPVTNENLIYLSSRQALYDIAHFCKTVMHTAVDAWVTFGGSYPGMLAAWSRLKFPHLIDAAVSNSAPIQAVLDFAAYNNHVGRVLQDPLVGGSFMCWNVFVTGHAELLDTLLETTRDDDSLNEIARAFQLCRNGTALQQDDHNIQLFVGDGLVDLHTQSNDPSCDDTGGPFCNIARICQHAVDYFAELEAAGSKKPAMEALGRLARETYAEEKEEDYCLELDWEGVLEYVADPKQGQEGGLRSWLWQTCTEFGFYQTCEYGSTCPYGQGWHPLSQDLELCQRAFGVDSIDVVKAVQATNEYYGGWHLAGSRILSVTGTIDPWTELAKSTTDDREQLPVHTVIGASHHFWTHPVKTTDSDEVNEARSIIYERVRQWLEQILLQNERNSSTSRLK